jgi:hypothetical protein
MNKPASSMIVADRNVFADQDGPYPHHDHDPAAIADLHQQACALQSELDEVQPLISAAFLAATAFRMRDNDSLVSALRILVGATKTFEERRAS